MSKLICPNCRKKLNLVVEDRQIGDDLYDVWTCDTCCHIIVLDWRTDLNMGNKNE